MEKTIKNFIKTRFPIDCNWLNGNCYYFAAILKARFPEGIIYYDVIDGHFVFGYEGKKYDWRGLVSEEGEHYYVKWDEFHNYDRLQKFRIMENCIM